MVWGSSEGEIYAFPDMADGAGGVSASFHDRLHGQWCHYFPQRSLIFADPRRKRFWKKTSYAVRAILMFLFSTVGEIHWRLLKEPDIFSIQYTVLPLM